MIPKSRIIHHPSGQKIVTPLLIPSFSSKGFEFWRKKKKWKTEAALLVNNFKEYITESVLVSGYDLYHKFIPSINDLPGTQITFIDSGGYESLDFEDFTGVSVKPYPIMDWNPQFYEKVLDQWPKDKPSAIVNFDGFIGIPTGGKASRMAIESQIEQAKGLFAKHPDKWSNFLLKAETKGGIIPIEKLLQENIVNNLRAFSIIGVTEKELGKSLMERLTNIRKLRNTLDQFSIESPIHIFGGLDPLGTILYYIAGAEIFDGLTWLKFGFRDLVGLYWQNSVILDHNFSISSSDDTIRRFIQLKNILRLEKIKQTLIEFSSSKDFSLFDELSSQKGIGLIIKNHITSIEAQIQK